MKLYYQSSQHSVRSGTAVKQRGAVLALVAIAIFSLLAIAALAIDVGFNYVKKTTLQTALDAMALSVVTSLVDDRIAQAPGDGRNTFAEYESYFSNVTANDINICFFDTYNAIDTTCAQTVATINTRFVRVSNNTPLSVATTFATILGIDTFDIRSSAVAGPLSENEVCNVIPVMACVDHTLTDDEKKCDDYSPGKDCLGYTIGQEYTLKETDWNAEIGAGNFGFMDVGSGANIICEALASNDFCHDFGEEAPTETGGMSGPTACANVRFDDYTHGREAKFGGDPFYPPDTNIADYAHDFEGDSQFANYIIGGETPTTHPPGEDYRRIVNLPIIDCSKGEPGKNFSIPVQAIGCFFLTRKVIEGGSSEDKFSLFAEFVGDHNNQDEGAKEACSLDSTPTPDDHTAPFTPQRVVIYKDPENTGA